MAAQKPHGVDREVLRRLLRNARSDAGQRRRDFRTAPAKRASAVAETPGQGLAGIGGSASAQAEVSLSRVGQPLTAQSGHGLAADPWLRAAGIGQMQPRRAAARHTRADTKAGRFSGGGKRRAIRQNRASAFARSLLIVRSMQKPHTTSAALPDSRTSRTLIHPGKPVRDFCSRPIAVTSGPGSGLQVAVASPAEE